MSDQATEQPTEQRPIEDPLVVQYINTDSASATYFVEHGRIGVTFFRNATALRTRNQAIEAASRITRAAGWPAWKVLNLERIKDTYRGKEIEMVYVSGKIE